MNSFQGELKDHIAEDHFHKEMELDFHRQLSSQKILLENISWHCAFSHLAFVIIFLPFVAYFYVFDNSIDNHAVFIFNWVIDF